MMAKGPATGYVYGIKDPRHGKFVFIGNGHQPWVSVIRHLTDSSNVHVKKWAQELVEDVGPNVEILGEIIARQYHGEQVNIPPVTPGKVRVEWEILGEETETLNGKDDVVTINHRTLKSQIVQKLLDEGHPLLNGRVG